MVFWDSLHTKMWARRSYITCGPWRRMASSLTPKWVSVLLPKTWEKPHMLSLEDITQPRSSEEHKGSRPSRTIQTGSEHGLWKAKACIMELSQCRSQARTQHTQLLLILEALSFPFHQMYSTRSKLNGARHSQISTAPATRLSATSLKDAILSPPRSSQSVSKWAITSSKSTQHSTCIKQTKTNATSSFTNAVFQERTRTSSWLEMLSLGISILYMILIRIR